MSKFKVGDKVRCVRDYRGAFTIGKQYEIGGRFHTSEDDRCGIVMDDGGSANGHYESYFELVTNSPARIRTVTQIVEGVYGRLSIKQQGGDEPRLLIALANLGGHVEMVHHGWSLDELSEAITNLTAIRNALQEQGK